MRPLYKNTKSGNRKNKENLKIALIVIKILVA